jgi:hypothetical protein
VAVDEVGEPTMTLLALYLAAGILNAAVAFDQNILMLSMPGWRRSLDAWVEAVLYVLLWPLQLAWKILVGINVASSWVLGKVMG